MIYTTQYHSPVGELLLAAKDDALIGLWIEGQKYFLGSLKESMTVQNDHPVLQSATDWLDRYFAGEKPFILVGEDSHLYRWRVKLETILSGSAISN